MTDGALPRSFLFVPALRADFVDKAAASGAGAVILDLEDAIPPARKLEARATIRDAVATFAARSMRTAVRVNAGDALDIAAACDAGAWAVVMPKVARPGELEAFRSHVRGAARRPLLLATIETARGLVEAPAIAEIPEVDALMFGAGDFALDTGMAYHEDALSGPASWVVVAARAAGRPAYGLPGPITDIADLERLQRIAERARALGFSGTPVIHPRQVPVVERVFAPSEAEFARAREIVRKFEASDGLPSADAAGLVEWPTYKAALEMLRSAGRS